MGQMTDFQLFIKTNKLKQKQVAEYLGTSPQYISQVAKGTCLLSDDKYELLVRSNWDISMLKIPSYINVPSAVMSPYTDSDQINSQRNTFAEAIKSGHNIVADASNIDLKEIPVEIVEEIEEKVKEEMAIPIITSEIASTPNTNIKKYIRDKGDELKRIYINDLTQGARVAECVESTSMWPMLQPGDWVFVKFIDKDSIIDGKTYYFDLNTLPTMIRKVKIENDKLRLIAKNPNYGDIIIRLNEVNNIAKIVGMWRSYFGDQFDEIEALRAKKEQQIDNLIDEIRDSGKRTDRVMEQNYELMQKLMEKLK